MRKNRRVRCSRPPMTCPGGGYMRSITPRRQTGPSVRWSETIFQAEARRIRQASTYRILGNLDSLIDWDYWLSVHRDALDRLKPGLDLPGVQEKTEVVVDYKRV